MAVTVLALPTSGLAWGKDSDKDHETVQQRNDGDHGRAAGANGDHKITICHATGSEKNPYVEITVDEHAVDDRGHDHHQDGRDMIPAPPGGCPGAQHVATATKTKTPVPATATKTKTPVICVDEVRAEHHTDEDQCPTATKTNTPQ